MDIERLAGTKLGNYEIESLLGQGGMGVVYKARQISLNRAVALKILPPTLSSDLSFVRRFQREARAMARIHQQRSHILGEANEKDNCFLRRGRLDPATSLHSLVATGGSSHTRTESLV